MNERPFLGSWFYMPISKQSSSSKSYRRRVRRLQLPSFHFPAPFANQGIGLKVPQLLAVKSRIAGKALLVVYAASVLAAAMPIQISAPAWYLALCNSLVNNGAILVLALLALNLAAYWDPAAKANRNFASPLLWISRLSTAVFGAVVVVQLMAAGHFAKQVLAQNSAQLSGLMRQLDVVAADVEAAQDPAQFNLLLQRLGSPPVLPSAAQSEPLPARKQQLLKVLQDKLRSEEGRLGQKRRQIFFDLALNSVRVVVTAAALATACQGFSQWNGANLALDKSTEVVG